MRCMRLFQALLLMLAVFFSFAAKGDTIELHAHATLLIQQYLIQHPMNRNKVVEQQKRITKDIQQQWHRLSTYQIKKIISLYESVHAVWPVYYPVRSLWLTPGKVLPRSTPVALSFPFFIVGDDAQSVAWLKHYQHRLSTLHAKGFVVNVKTKKAMHALQRQFSSLSLIALSGDVLAKGLKLRHYPVLISHHFIEQ